MNTQLDAFFVIKKGWLDDVSVDGKVWGNLRVWNVSSRKPTEPYYTFLEMQGGSVISDKGYVIKSTDGIWVRPQVYYKATCKLSELL